MDFWKCESSKRPEIHSSNDPDKLLCLTPDTPHLIHCMTHFLADATNEQIGVFIFAAAVVTGFVATLISVASYFATRREVEDLKARVDKLENDLDDKTSKIHKRVNRLLAGQMLIAGRMGCSLEQHQDQISAWMAKLEREED
jgi:outer membrane murein-binding lipoprotein Lpp